MTEVTMNMIGMNQVGRSVLAIQKGNHIFLLTDNQAVGVDGASDAVEADVGVVGEAVLASDPAQRGVNLPAGLGHGDEL